MVVTERQFFALEYFPKQFQGSVVITLFIVAGCHVEHRLQGRWMVPTMLRLLDLENFPVEFHGGVVVLLLIVYHSDIVHR